VTVQRTGDPAAGRAARSAAGPASGAPAGPTASAAADPATGAAADPPNAAAADPATGAAADPATGAADPATGAAADPATGAAADPATGPAAGPAARYAKPTRDEIAGAVGLTIPDLLGEDMRVLFAGINPSLYSAATGHHFARPGNRFWPALHRSGFTPRTLHPAEQFALPVLGLGITNVVARATARADELSPAELVDGGALLAELVSRWRPRFLAILGVTAYRTAFARPRAVIGPQDHELGGVRVWVLPNPSGLNARFQIDDLAAEFAALRRAMHEADPPIADAGLRVPPPPL
jgi:double-stranded uracil-DNA glycosylase